ncbi:hypothetical protein GGR10_000676 [Bartonella chomelii]|uniref:Uncharacterized protein n=1 Tax=Bartonella chomelii TaxID=236402 RepID=A0ABR6E2P3_9HYPH|nr:hypothetical protein [Bartonella chomelii]
MLITGFRFASIKSKKYNNSILIKREGNNLLGYVTFDFLFLRHSYFVDLLKVDRAL